MLDKNYVIIEECDSYDQISVYNTIIDIFEKLDFEADYFKNKKIVIKPNLVRKMDPASGGTTHPSIIKATVKVLKEYGAESICIAESPGGFYTEPILKNLYIYNGYDKLTSEGVELNYDTGSTLCSYEKGIVSNYFNIINPIYNADIIINISKLKSHGLTVMTGSTKNLFGTIPGTEKFEMHARFPDIDIFSKMLIDLYNMLSENREIINITDAVVGMEGNGPTNGNPRKIGLITASRNSYCLDYVSTIILNCVGKVKTINYALEYGLFDVSQIKILGNDYNKHIIKDFVFSDSSFNPVGLLSNKKLLKIFSPRPIINKIKCVGCGVCIRSCPKKTISFVIHKNNKIAHINKKNCIKCFCCQELCPSNAVDIKKNLILRLVK